MADVKILSLIPESLHETLIEEVQEVLKDREKTKPAEVRQDLKNWAAKNYPTTKLKK